MSSDSRLFAGLTGFVLLQSAPPHLPLLVCPTVSPRSFALQALLICCLISADEWLSECACTGTRTNECACACQCGSVCVCVCACVYEASRCGIFSLCATWLQHYGVFVLGAAASLARAKLQLNNKLFIYHFWECVGFFFFFQLKLIYFFGVNEI